MREQQGAPRVWGFAGRSGAIAYQPKGAFRTNDAEQIRAAVLTDLGLAHLCNGLLLDDALLKRIVDLRNDVSHGNEPITPKLIEEAAEFRDPLEELAFRTLHAIRDAKLNRAIAD